MKSPRTHFLLLASCLWILASPSSQAIIDTNSNTLSDLWEKSFNTGQLFPATPNFLPLADPDQDTWTNAQEAEAGTNPFNSNPPLGFLQLQITTTPAVYYTSPETGQPALLTPAAFVVKWPTLVGKNYTLLLTPDLSPGSWLPVGPPIIGQGTPVTIAIAPTNDDGNTPAKLFWRVGINDLDSDGDGLTNHEENQLGTHPAKPDTDLDGILDGQDATPLANNAIANPDGENFPASLATNLTGRWNLETITTTNGLRTTPNLANSAIPAYLGGATSVDDKGMVSKAIQMSAMNQYLKTAPSIIAGKASFSISFWFRFEKNSIQTKPGTLNTVLCAFNDVLDSTPQFQLHAYKALTSVATQKLVFSHYSNKILQTDIVGEIPLSAALDDGNWQHLTLTKSSGTLRIYRNAQQVMTGSIQSGAWPNGTNGYLCFGALVPATLVADTNFRGSMDRLLTWSNAITASQVTALYQQDIDRDGIWDVTECNTRYSDYQGSVTYHPNPADPNAPQPLQTGYARSPFLFSRSTLDFDQDELSDLEEQTRGTALTKPDTDDDDLLDGFEVANSFNPLTAYSQGATGPRDAQSDPDSDTLSTLTEYLNGSNPRSANSDGDSKNDAAEIAQGSNPAGAADRGAAPTDPPELVPFRIFGDYTAWETTIRGKGPKDTRTQRIRMSAHNVAADQSIKLLKNNAYEMSLRYLRTKPGENVPWYCWETKIDSKATPTFIVANHWLVDNRSGLLADHSHSHGTNLVADKTVPLLPVDLISDLNNDGQITAADNPLRDAAAASGATDEIKDKGTEFIFHNDTLSNGIWDKEDTDPDRPATAKDDDDAEEITIKVGITEGEVWLDHPAIAGLSFYKTRECNAADKVNLSPTSKFTVSASNPFPDKLFMRADGTLTYPDANPQFEGDLVLKIKVGTNGQEIEAVKMKLTVVKQLGAKKYFHAARDYIMENNSRIFVRDKAYGSSTSFRVVSMLEELARMYPIDAARRTTGAPFKGIDQVNAAYDGSIHVVVNGNMNFFSDDRFNGTVGNIAAALQGLITDKCHGRLVRMNSYDAAVSSDNTSSTSSPEGSDLAGDTYGRYIAQYNQENKYSLAAGRVPLPSPSGGPSAAMGGLSTNYSNADRVNREYQLIGYSKCTDTNKGIVFTATQLTGTGSGPSLAEDAKKSGVAALPSGDADDLQILLLDGGTSTAMAHAKPDGSLSTRVKKGKHTGTLYYINTYLLFHCEKPRP